MRGRARLESYFSGRSALQNRVGVTYLVPVKA